MGNVDWNRVFEDPEYALEIAIDRYRETEIAAQAFVEADMSDPCTFVSGFKSFAVELKRDLKAVQLAQDSLNHSRSLWFGNQKLDLKGKF